MSYTQKVSDLRTALNNTMLGLRSANPSAPADPSGIVHLGAFVAGGNVKTGESFFDASGLAGPNLSWSQDILYSWASCSKVLLGIVASKMMEEGLIQASDPASKYLTWMTGNGTYLTNVDFQYNSNGKVIFTTDNIAKTATVSINNVPQTVTYYCPSGSVINTSTFAWSGITIGQLIKMDLGLYDDIFLAGSGAASMYGYSLTATESILVADPLAAANLYQSGVIYNTVAKGQLTPFGLIRVANSTWNPTTQRVEDPSGNKVSVNPEDFIKNLINMNKAGIIPAISKPGSRVPTLQPNNVNQIPITYDLSYIVLGLVLDKCLRSKLGMTFADYTRAKIFNPCNMNDSYILLQDDISAPSIQSRIYTDSFRHAKSLNGLNFSDPTSPVSISADSTYNAINNDAVAANASWSSFGPLVWGSDYPNDGLFKVIKSVFRGDKTYDLSGNVICTYGNAPLLSSIRDFSKLLQMLANKGTYRGRTVLNQATFEYLISPKATNMENYTSNYPNSILTGDVVSLQLCFGNYKLNDVSPSTQYGYTQESRIGRGATGCGWVINVNTGFWCVNGMPETNFSTGNINPGGIYGLDINADYMAAII